MTATSYIRAVGDDEDLMFEYRPHHFISIRAAQTLRIPIPGAVQSAALRVGTSCRPKPRARPTTTYSLLD